MINDLPGHLEPIYSMTKWLDLLYKSRLSAEHKLAGTVLGRTCSYNKSKQLQLSAISNYEISRRLNLQQDTVQSLLDDLEHHGWIFYISNIGARKVYALTFSLLPVEAKK